MWLGQEEKRKEKQKTCSKSLKIQNLRRNIFYDKGCIRQNTGECIKSQWLGEKSYYQIKEKAKILEFLSEEEKKKKHCIKGTAWMQLSVTTEIN